MKEKQTEGIAVEIAVKDVKIDAFGRGPQLADGMNLCAGCEDVFTLRKYCGFCQGIHEELQALEARRPRQRIDMGVVPYDPRFDERDEHRPAPRWAVWAVLGAAVVVAMFVLTGMWYLGRPVIGACLDATK